MLKHVRSNSLVQVLGARAITFPIPLICGLLWLHLVIGHLGTADYAFLALIIGLQFLLGFLDFGTAAHVLESAGQYRVHKDLSGLGRALGAAWKTIIIGNLLFLMGAVALLFLGLWGPILGFPERTATAGLAVVLILAVNTLVRPLSLSTALVAGLGKPAIATWAQALTSLSSLGILMILLSLNAPLPFIAATPIAGQLVAFMVPFVVSLKTVPGLLKAAARGMWRSAATDQKLRHLAVPMLIIQIIGPLNEQLDRLVLSHLSTVDELAIFSLGAQLLVSAGSFLTALTPALWAEFAELRAKGGSRAAVARSLRYIKRFWMVGVLFGVAFATLSYALSPLISDGQLRLPWVFCAVLGATLALSGIDLVMGIGLTDPRSLRFQAVLLSFTTGINVALTVALAAPLGSLGPALASLIAMLIHLPLLSLLAWWRLHQEAPEDESSKAPGSVDSLVVQRKR
jgi:O-antigen/teichoic acid export membrane protein